MRFLLVLPGSVSGDERHVGVPAERPVLPKEPHELVLLDARPHRPRALVLLYRVWRQADFALPQRLEVGQGADRVGVGQRRGKPRRILDL